MAVIFTSHSGVKFPISGASKLGGMGTLASQFFTQNSVFHFFYTFVLKKVP